MPEIHLIQPINWGPQGPVARGPRGKEQPVFLHQGRLDGACGLYSVLMTLMICGVVDRAELESQQYDGRKRLGRFMERIRSLFRGLVLEGTYIDDLRDLISETFSTELTWEYYPESGEKIRQFVADHILADHPVIVGLRYHGGGHAVVGVGLEYIDQDNNKAFVQRFLLLDPWRSDKLDTPWNASVRTTAKRGRWPYRYDGGPEVNGQGVAFDTAMAVWRKS